MSTFPSSLPFDTDTELAKLHGEVQYEMQKITWAEDAIHRLAGDKRDRYTRTPVWAMPTAECIEIVLAAASRYADLPAYDAPDRDEAVAAWDSPVPLHDARRGIEQVEKRSAAMTAAQKLYERIAELNAVWEEHRWSRFFLVTSSAGHVHSSMWCSTCRPTTAYGWKPELSGKSEAEAVKALGPALCSVCFPSAPVAHQGGKITKAQAAKLAA
jgi:hypothetical protein